MPVNPAQVPDCVYYGDSATDTWSELATDDSGEATNITNGTTYVYETSSARSNLTEYRTVNVHLDGIDDTATGYMWTWDRGGGDHSSIRLDGAGNIIVTWDGGTTEQTLDSNFLSLGADEWLFTWAMEPNPATTGASDAKRSELRVWNLTGGNYEQLIWTHAAESGTASGSMIWGASNTSGANNLTAGTFEEIRLGSAFHSAAETYETFISQSAAPTLVGAERKVFAMPDRADVALGDDGQFGGVIHIMAGRAAEQHTSLLWSPLFSLLSVGDWMGDQIENLTNQNVGYLDSTIGAVLRIEWLKRVPVPPGATHIVPVVYAQHDRGDASDEAIVGVVSMSQPGPLVRPLLSPTTYERYYATTTITADHGTTSTGGAFYELSNVRIARDNAGFTYIALVINFDTAGVSSDLRVKMVSADPVFISSESGFGFGGFG